MKRKLFVHGELAEKYGSAPLCMHVADLRQMFDAWEFLHPGWERDFRDQGHVAIILRTGDRIQQMEEQFLMMPFGDAEEVHIVPRAVVNDPVSIGAWLVSSIGGVNFAAAVGATGVMIANWVAAAVVSFAISAVAGAVLNALSPKPKSASPNEKRDSHLLTNAPNYVEEGGVVPVIFGETEVSSTLINFGTYAEEMPLNE